MSGLLSFVLLLITCSVVYGNVISSQAENKSNYRLPKDVDVKNYDLSMEPDLTNFNFTGQVKITVKVLNEINSLTLNAKHLNVTKGNITVEAVDPKDPKVSVTDMDLQEEFEFLVIQLNGKLPKNAEYTLTINFTGELNNNKKGFYRSRYFDKDNNVKYIATTHFEPTGARWAFPCWDEPAYKAPFTVHITHSKKYKAISNMPLSGEPVKQGEDKLVSNFKKTPDISTYLVAFVVSDYDFVEGSGNFKVWTKPHAKEHGKYALEMGQKLINQLNQYTGLNYSNYIDKMDQVTIKDFSPSAMENWGLVTYRETSLLYEKGVTTTRTKHSIATVIAHEFAHQWFGNLVSPKWWKYIWLNEGFANYMQYFITHQLEPEWRLNETFVTANMQGNAFVADAVQNVRPMNKDAQSPSEISSLFDSIGYQKAGSVIRMMSYILTPPVFQKGLQDYLKKHEKKAADSDDLLLALQNAAGENKTWEGAKFKEVMNEWINKPGFPVVNVKKGKDGEFQVSQERFLSDGSTDATKWWVPLTYTHESKLEFENTTVVAWLKANNESVTLKIDKADDWIILNKLQAGYYRVNYEEENWKKLESYLNSDNYVKIPAVNRAQLLDDALNLALVNRLPYPTALSLTNYLNREDNYVPWSTAFRNLNFLNSMMRNSKRYYVFQKYIGFITKKLVKDVGFEVKEDDKDLQKMLKTDLMKWACRAGVEECTKYVNDKYNSWLGNSTQSLDVDSKNTILCAGVRTADFDNWKNTLHKLLNSTKDEDEKRSLMLNVPACSNSEEILNKYLNSTLEESFPVSFDVAVQGIVSEHAKGASIALKTLLKQQEKIKKLPNANNVIKTCVQVIASNIKSREEYVQLSFFVTKQGLEAKDLQDVTLKALKNVEWLEANQEVVEKWLVSNEVLFKNSATSVTFASFLLLLSIFITRFY